MVRKQVNLPGQFSDSHLASMKKRRYEDEGCEFALSCLECPFPECRQDKPRMKGPRLSRLVTAERDRDIIEKSEAGWPRRDIAGHLGITKGTVDMVIRNHQRRVHE